MSVGATAIAHAAQALRDDPDYAVRFSSGSTWDAATGTNLLDAHVTIEP